MGALMLNSIPYTGFSDGTTIIPNPSGTATTELTSISIDGVVYSIPVTPSPLSNDFYLLNPNKIDLSQTSGMTKTGYASFLEKDQASSSSAISSIASYNNVYCLKLPAYGNKIFSITDKVNKLCQSIEVVCAVVTNSSYGSWNNSQIILSSNPVPSAAGSYDSQDVIHNWYLTFYNDTIDINNQDYIIINSSTRTSLDYQTVVIDVNSIAPSTDFYVGLTSCDCDFYIRSIEAKY